ncbi:olfactory receptor 1030-like [Sarcophilus harrisii]|uniref:olfactory receptor 1030-like n=1 Tax=Sarcophilus harrisii TaxID=9305 RepID=UPI000273C477|nr:olfactory receptor 1030-like [Sarcophilus harrisii]
MGDIKVWNETEVTEFVLLGLSDNPKLQPVLFVIFLFIYTSTMVGNLGMILLIKIESRLHTPMYFFLSCLSFVDSSYSSSITPRMLVNLFDEKKAISFNGCAAQFYFFGSFVGIECFLLAMMAYDRYVAICYPLLYSVIMSERICLLLVVTAFLGGFSNAAVHTGMTFRLSFCGSNLINHFYCDTPPLLKLSCSDTRMKTVLRQNSTEATEFILLGLVSQPELQPVLFVVFLVIYLITLTGNFGMIILIRLTPRLQTPMYFFLTHLALVDLFYSTNVSPQMLINFLSEKKTISYIGCLTQCFIFVTLLLTEYYMLGAMAYDRYIAICKPLHYSTKMSKPVCICLIIFPYLWGSMVGTMQVILTSRLSFCGPNTINHFYCADPPLLMLTCSDTYIKQTALFVSAGLNLTGSLLIILTSYIFIFATILRMRSTEGQRKAFSTCGSHLMAVTMFYGSLFCMYLRPATESSVEQGKIVAVFCIFVSPMLNPFIYSLRNKDVKEALKKMANRNIGKTGNQ